MHEQDTTIGIKQLHLSIPQITRATKRGASFVVMRHTKPLFRIEPLRETQKKYTLHDVTKLQFKDKDRRLSTHIDRLLYGRS